MNLDAIPLLAAAATSVALLAVATAARADDPAVLRDLEAAGYRTLTLDELKALMPGAAMKRTSGKGNAQLWKNDADGSFIISSENRDRGKGVSTARGKWHLADDGRYCVLIEWNTIPTEEWCRYIVRSGDAYYATKSDKTGTEKVYRLEIGR